MGAGRCSRHRSQQRGLPFGSRIYYIEVRCEEVVYRGVTGEHTVFYIDPLLETVDERVLQLEPRLYELGAGNFHAGSLRVYEMPGNLVMYEGINYTADPATGRITLASPLPPGSLCLVITAMQVRAQGLSCWVRTVPTTGLSLELSWLSVVVPMRATLWAVIVTRDREEAAKEYGGSLGNELGLRHYGSGCPRPRRNHR